MIKKRIAVLFVCLLGFVFSARLNAQGNLQFNQVKLVTSRDTVPAGKVWKLESAPYKIDAVGIQGNYTTANPAVEYVQSIFIDNKTIFVQAIRYYDGSWHTFTGPTCQFPMWIPEGTSLEAGTGVQFISVIEFNVTP